MSRCTCCTEVPQVGTHASSLRSGLRGPHVSRVTRFRCKLHGNWFYFSERDDDVSARSSLLTAPFLSLKATLKGLNAGKRSPSPGAGRWQARGPERPPYGAASLTGRLKNAAARAPDAPRYSRPPSGAGGPAHPPGLLGPALPPPTFMGSAR